MNALKLLEALDRRFPIPAEGEIRNHCLTLKGPGVLAVHIWINGTRRTHLLAGLPDCVDENILVETLAKDLSDVA